MSIISEGHTKFWYLVWKYYPTHKFPDKETLLVYARETQEYSLEDLNYAFSKYRKTPGNAHPPAPNSLIGIIDPLLTDAGQEIYAEYLYERVIKIGRYGKTSEHLNDFDYGVIQELPNGSATIFNTTYRPSVITMIKNIVERKKSPGVYEQLAATGTLIGFIPPQGIFKKIDMGAKREVEPYSPGEDN